MRSVILNLKDISDSTEVYESRPHPFFKLFIHLLLLLLLVSGVWCYFSKIDIVVSADGVVKTSETSVTVTNEVAGMVSLVNCSDGQIVNKGDVIYEIEHKSAIQEYEKNKQELQELNSRLQMLQAYNDILTGKIIDFSNFETNIYFSEYKARLDLINAQCQSSYSSSANQKEQFTSIIDSVNHSITYNNDKISNLSLMVQCILNRENIFSSDTLYFYNTVNSYINQYLSLEAEYEQKINNSNGDSDLITQLINEKQNALSELEYEKITSIESEIEVANSNGITLNNSKNEAESQLNGVNENTVNNNIQIVKLTEVNAVYGEITTYQSKIEELNSNIKVLDENIQKAKVRACKSGIVNFIEDLVVGNYLQSGSEVLKVIPEDDSEYIVEAYIKNQDIGKLKNGMEVKCEISTYAADDYGLLYGKVKNISKDIKASDENNGSTYYTALIQLENKSLYNRNGEEGNLKVGMVCKASIITGEKRMLYVALEKIDLWD